MDRTLARSVPVVGLGIGLLEILTKSCIVSGRTYRGVMSTAATYETRSERPGHPGEPARARLRSVEAGAADGAGSVDEVGLVDALSSMAETLRQLTRDFPMWSLPEAQVGEAVGHAQAVRELSQSLTAVLAREADARGLGVDDGLSRADWLRVQAGAGVAGGVLDGSAAAAVTRVGAAMNEPRWARLAERVAAAEVPVAHAAAIIRFHDDVARIADSH